MSQTIKQLSQMDGRVYAFFKTEAFVSSSCPKQSRKASHSKTELNLRNGIQVI